VHVSSDIAIYAAKRKLVEVNVSSVQFRFVIKTESAEIVGQRTWFGREAVIRRPSRISLMRADSYVVVMIGHIQQNRGRR